MTTAVLFTLDEARDNLGASAIALVDAVDCFPARLARLLHALAAPKASPVPPATTPGLPGPQRRSLQHLQRRGVTL